MMKLFYGGFQFQISIQLNIPSRTFAQEKILLSKEQTQFEVVWLRGSEKHMHFFLYLLGILEKE